MLYLANINLNQNELQNAIIQPLATAPSSPKLGQIYCNSTNSKIMWYTGTQWQTVGVVVESSSTNGNIKVDGTEMSVYTLPIATTSTIGGVKIGAGLAIDANGLLSTTGGVADAVEWSNVLNKPADLVEDASYVHTDNNYTTTEKNKLSGIASGAEVNVNADWNSTSGDSQILNKPTALSAFTNDENFIDNTVGNLINYYTKAETYTQSEIGDLISAISTLNILVVDSLPTTDISTTTIYLVAKTPTGGSEDGYDEYIYVSSKVETDKWEMIGNTVIDLSNYLQTTGNASNTTVAFSQAGSRTAITSGESLATLMGKIAKYFADLGTYAYKSSILSTDLPSGTVIDSSYVHTDNNYTTTEKNKLAGIESGAEANNVSKVTGTLSSSATTATINVTGTVLNVEVIDSVTLEKVITNVSFGTNQGGTSVTVSTSVAPTNTLNIIVTVISD